MGTGNSRVSDADMIWTCQYCTQPFPTFQGAELHEKHCPDKSKRQLPKCHLGCAPHSTDHVAPQTASPCKVNFRKVLRKDFVSVSNVSSAETTRGAEKRKQAWDACGNVSREHSRSSILKSRRGTSSRHTRPPSVLQFRRGVSVQEFEEDPCRKEDTLSVSSESTHISDSSSRSSLSSSKSSTSSKLHRTKQTRASAESKLVAGWLGSRNERCGQRRDYQIQESHQS